MNIWLQFTLLITHSPLGVEYYTAKRFQYADEPSVPTAHFPHFYSRVIIIDIVIRALTIILLIG